MKTLFVILVSITLLASSQASMRGALAAFSIFGSSPLEVGPGPVMPWMVESCITPVKKAMPMIKQFAKDAQENDVDAICQQVAALKRIIPEISSNCWIGDHSNKTATKEFNANQVTATAQNVMGAAAKVGESEFPINNFADELKTFINAFPELANNCN